MCDAEENKPIFIKRKRGTVLLYKGRQYYKQRVYKNGNEIWQCSLLKKKTTTKCLGTITISNGQIIKEVSHICKENYLKNEVDCTIKSAKAEAQTSDLPIPQIYKKHLGPLFDRGVHLCENVPLLANLKSDMYSKRYEALGVNKIKFGKLQGIQIPLKFKDFCIGDYSYKDSRILVFCTEEAKEMMLTIDEYFIDGTFKSCPEPFKQLLVIHGDLGGSTAETNTLPLVFALLPDKKLESYMTVLEIIKSQLTKHTDYEKAIIKSIHNVFPEVLIKGCYYHYIKCLYKKAHELGLKQKGERRFVGLCVALSLLPENFIDEGWEYIQNMSEPLKQNKKLNKFLKYMSQTWLKGDFRNEWCIYQERHRTNNIAESWNATLNKALCNNVTILRLLNVLLRATHDRGSIPKKRRSDQTEKDNLICETQLSLLQGDITVGHCLEILR